MELRIEVSRETFINDYNNLFGKGKAEEFIDTQLENLTTEQEANILLVMVGQDTEFIVDNDVVSLTLCRFEQQGSRPQLDLVK